MELRNTTKNHGQIASFIAYSKNGAPLKYMSGVSMPNQIAHQQVKGNDICKYNSEIRENIFKYFIVTFGKIHVIYNLWPS
jgi:hypothetical protein